MVSAPGRGRGRGGAAGHSGGRRGGGHGGGVVSRARISLGGFFRRGSGSSMVVPNVEWQREPASSGHQRGGRGGVSKEALGSAMLAWGRDSLEEL